MEPRRRAAPSAAPATDTGQRKRGGAAVMAVEAKEAQLWGKPAADAAAAATATDGTANAAAVHTPCAGVSPPSRSAVPADATAAAAAGVPSAPPRCGWQRQVPDEDVCRVGAAAVHVGGGGGGAKVGGPLPQVVRGGRGRVHDGLPQTSGGGGGVAEGRVGREDGGEGSTVQAGSSREK